MESAAPSVGDVIKLVCYLTLSTDAVAHLWEYSNVLPTSHSKFQTNLFELLPHFLTKFRFSSIFPKPEAAVIPRLSFGV